MTWRLKTPSCLYLHNKRTWRCFSKVVWINSTSMLMLCSMVNYRHDSGSVTLLSCILKCCASICFFFDVSLFVYFTTFPYVCFTYAWLQWHVCVVVFGFCLSICVSVCVGFECCPTPSAPVCPSDFVRTCTKGQVHNLHPQCCREGDGEG